MTIQHTPTPWVAASPSPMMIQSSSYWERPDLKIILAKDGSGPINIDAKANAEFIVRACNAYDDLVQAVEDALLIAELHNFEGAAIENFKRVLKKAKGENNI